MGLNTIQFNIWFQFSHHVVMDAFLMQVKNAFLMQIKWQSRLVEAISHKMELAEFATRDINSASEFCAICV